MSVNAADFNDPINLQVMWNRLIFIADQADIVLGRTAFSPIVRENHDYVTVLLDSRGRAAGAMHVVDPGIHHLAAGCRTEVFPAEVSGRDPARR
ncbi:N-methylhydantoinase B/oxoprolinase/acetone carboxylase alpha subunit [Bradyrhizobium sp. S3.14.4]